MPAGSTRGIGPNPLHCADQRRMMHARVPYDGANEDRLMWRVGFGPDLPEAGAGPQQAAKV